MKSSEQGDNNGVVRSSYPLYSSYSGQNPLHQSTTPMTFQPHVFTPVHFSRPYERSNIQGVTNTQQSNFIPTVLSSPTINKELFKKIIAVKKVDDKELSVHHVGKKMTKPAFLSSMRDAHISEKGSTQDTASLKKQQSESYLHSDALRSTFSTGGKRNQIGNQKLANLRVTHGFGKIGSVLMEARKYDDEENKKFTSKSGINSQSILTNNHFEAPMKLSTQTKKMIEKGPFNSLDQMNAHKVSFSQRIKSNIINGFQILREVGKGKFGEVFLSLHVQTGFIVALKKIIKAKVAQYKMIEQFKRQIRLHSALDHPHIVKFYGFFQDDLNIYLILEYVGGGTLFQHLDQVQHLPADKAAQFLKDTIQAIAYLHDRSIAHRDIKPENIVLTSQGIAKLCDFGWSALVESSRTTYCGTFDYAPPEILQRKNYNTAVDMWCIGVLAYQLMTGRVPFQGEKRKDIMEKIISVDKTKIKYPVEIPEDAKNFIQVLVQKDPSLRPKCKDLIRHPFIVNNTVKIPAGSKKIF